MTCMTEPGEAKGQMNVITKLVARLSVVCITSLPPTLIVEPFSKNPASGWAHSHAVNKCSKFNQVHGGYYEPKNKYIHIIKTDAFFFVELTDVSALMCSLHSPGVCLHAASSEYIVAYFSVTSPQKIIAWFILKMISGSNYAIEVSFNFVTASTADTQSFFIVDT